MEEFEKRLAVAEHFYSIQGEGQTMGKRAYFLRLAACNLMCGGVGTEKDGQLHNGATWRCDSIEVWQKGKKYDFHQIIELMGGAIFIKNLKEGAHLVVTGGEPLIQQKVLTDFLIYLTGVCGGKPIVEIETNGTIEPNTILKVIVDYWNVSPKLANSGETEQRRFKPQVLQGFSKLGKKVIFKFVISNNEEFSEMVNMTPPGAFHNNQVYLMPAGSTQEELAVTSPIVAALCIKAGCHYSHRIHISIWNQKTGV